MAKFFVKQDADYVVGHLRYGHREGYIEADSIEDAKKKLEREYSNDQQVTRVTPRAFIVLSDNDHAVLPVNGVNYYFECYRHDVPASLHVYPTGGHGWGIRTSFAFHVEMMQELRTWLNSF